MFDFLKRKKRISDVYFYVSDDQFKNLEQSHKLFLEGRESEFVEKRFLIEKPVSNTGDIILLLDAVWAATNPIYRERKRQIVNEFFETNLLDDFAEPDRAYIRYLVSCSMIAENSGAILESDRSRAQDNPKPDLDSINVLLTNLFRTEPVLQ